MSAADDRMRRVAWRRRRYGHPRSRAAGGVEKTITFPATPLVSRGWIALQFDPRTDYRQWVWADISDYIRWESGVTVEYGRRENSDTVDAATAQLVLDNRDGRFSRQNPLSPYYGYLQRGTPIWLAVDPGDGFHDRYFGHIVDLPKRWDRSATDSTLPITCRGPLHRMVRQQPLRSAVRTTIAASAPVYYWPMEDGADATQFASALANSDPLTFTRTPTPGAVSALDGSGAFADFDGTAALIVDSFQPVSITATAGYLAIAFTWAATKVNAKHPGWSPIAIELGTGTVSQVEFRAYGRWNGSSFDTLAIDFGSVGTRVATSGTFDPFDGEGHDILAVAEQSGANVVYELFVDGTSYGTNSVAGTLGVPSILYGPRAIDISWGGLGNTDNTGSTFGIGHVAVHDTDGQLATDDLHGAATAWVGEQAHERAARRADEDGYSFYGQGAVSAELGVQPEGNNLDVQRDLEKAEIGTVYEREFGLAFKTLAEYYNQPVSLALDIAEGHITDDLEPSDNDTRFKNRWTAKRDGGSEATVDLGGGTLPADALIYAASDTFNLHADDQLADQAGWLVHRDGFDDDYWPAIDINFAKHPELIPDWVALPYGGRTTVDNMMSQAGLSQLNLIVEGWREHWNSKQWSASLNTSPASIYTVGVLDDDTLCKLDSGSSSLTSDITSSATSISVTTTDSADLWTTDSAEWTEGSNGPLDIVVGGEVMRVTNIAGASSPQTFTVTRAVNGIEKAHTAGTEVHVLNALVLAR